MTRKTVETVRCIANRGCEYVVGFDERGDIEMVAVIVQPPTAQHPYWRYLYDARYGKPMGVTAACAARAGIEERKRQRSVGLERC